MKTFIVKSQSIDEFLKNNLIGTLESSHMTCKDPSSMNPYGYFREKLYIKKGGFMPSDQIVFILKDFASGSRKPIKVLNKRLGEALLAISDYENQNLWNKLFRPVRKRTGVI